MRFNFALLGLASAAGLSAATISEFSGNTAVQLGIYSYGQVVTTPAAGGPWNRIRFCFGCEQQAAMLFPGTLYVLRQEYLGTPSGLPAAAGLLASTSATENFGWVFNESLALEPGTTYYFYETGTWQGLLRDPRDPAGPFSGYITQMEPNRNSAFMRTDSMVYRLDGEPIPEPASAMLLTIGLGAAVYSACLRRMQTSSLPPRAVCATVSPTAS